MLVKRLLTVFPLLIRSHSVEKLHRLFGEYFTAGDSECTAQGRYPCTWTTPALCLLCTIDDRHVFPQRQGRYEYAPNTIAVNNFSLIGKVVRSSLDIFVWSTPALVLPAVSVPHCTLPAARLRVVGGIVQATHGSWLTEG